MISIENRFTSLLPADVELKNYVRQVESACYSFCRPKSVKNPNLLIRNDSLAKELGFEPSFYESHQFLEVFSGKQLLSHMKPYAMCYGGHQFGNWAGQLGDGRAINIAEINTPNGLQTLQLKGAGMTPYSRHADGLAVLRSSIREYLCSEAMHHLGVPTTRALSLCLSGDLVERDMFYDGNPKFEPGAVLCRVSPSFIRFGSFEILAANGDTQILKQLVDYCIEYDFKDMQFSEIKDSQQRYIAWFEEIAKRSLELVIHWHRVGFVHGVMNTDNMSILGLTIDYGPYGWIDDYDPSWTPNTTDLPGKRYCFANQARIVQWNLVQLAQSLLPLVPDVQALQKVVDDFPESYQKSYLEMMAKKLGIASIEIEFIQELEQLLVEKQMDMTLFFRSLAGFKPEDTANYFQECSYLDAEKYSVDLERLNQWLEKYKRILLDEDRPIEDRQQSMNENNPWFVLRNYITQQVIDAAEIGDFGLLNEINDILKSPYVFQQKHQKFFAKRPEWAKEKAGCSMLSCSS